MAKIKRPASSFIHRNIERVSLQVRIPQEIKDRAEAASKKHDTSLNLFTEAALLWYLEELERERD